MVARSVAAPERGIPRVHQLARPAARVHPAIRHSLKPRLVAIAPGAAEVVRYAGGWLFDKVLSGWDVTVITTQSPDRRPLRILGVGDATLEHALSYPAAGSCCAAIAVSAELYDSDERVRGVGNEVPADFGTGADPVAHRLSVAARAFKAQAMAAAAVCGEGPTDTEVFRRGEIRSFGLASAVVPLTWLRSRHERPRWSQEVRGRSIEPGRRSAG